ncbi:DUF397 domain-containing protein [Streptomyces xantholiticus]
MVLPGNQRHAAVAWSVVRDSKVERSPQLAVSPASWTSFVSYATQA